MRPVDQSRASPSIEASKLGSVPEARRTSLRPHARSRGAMPYTLLAASQGDVDAFIARDPLFKARTEPGWALLGEKAPVPSSGPVANDLGGFVDKLWQPLAVAGLVFAIPFWVGRELVSDHYR